MLSVKKDIAVYSWPKSVGRIYAPSHYSTLKNIMILIIFEFAGKSDDIFWYYFLILYDIYDIWYYFSKGGHT